MASSEETVARKLQRVFAGMKQRCYQQNHDNYQYYGARGVRICDEWLASGTSEAFVAWGLANGYELGLQIDRVDTTGDYTPDNCRFVTCRANNRNQRYHVYGELGGIRVRAVEALENINPQYTSIELGILLHRLRIGWSLEKALATPIIKKVKRNR
ncbi:hypothetical protein A8B98_22820 [Hymenobacter sp. UV11]|nr:hypothetical protein A8B98_22820 [Hymenobacter sp. UV11]